MHLNHLTLFHKVLYLNRRSRSREFVVRSTDTLITTDFSVLTLALLHKGLKFGVIRLRDGLGLHLDYKLAARRFNALLNANNGLF